MNPQNIKKAEKLTPTERKKVVGTFKNAVLYTESMATFRGQIERVTSKFKMLSIAFPRKEKPPQNEEPTWVRIYASEIEGKIKLNSKNWAFAPLGARYLHTFSAIEAIGFQVYEPENKELGHMYIVKDGEEVVLTGGYLGLEQWVSTFNTQTK